MLDTHFSFTYYVAILFQLFAIFICFVIHLFLRLNNYFKIQKIVTKISKIIKLKKYFFYYK